MTVARQLVLHIPHDARCIPDAMRQGILLDDVGLERELLAMTDAHTNSLFQVTAAEAGRVVCPVSRLVCDVERFADDADEPMAARGMGVIYTQTSTGSPLRLPPDTITREQTMQAWYWPHHRRLAALVEETVGRTGQCLVLDCHSFSSSPLPYEPNQDLNRADICIGTDSFHTPAPLRDAFVSAAQAQGFTVSVDQPFAGALVPMAAYRRDRRVLALMIEVNRRLYMDEVTGARNRDFVSVYQALGAIIDAASGMLSLTLSNEEWIDVVKHPLPPSKPTSTESGAPPSENSSSSGFCVPPRPASSPPGNGLRAFPNVSHSEAVALGMPSESSLVIGHQCVPKPAKPRKG